MCGGACATRTRPRRYRVLCRIGQVGQLNGHECIGCVGCVNIVGGVEERQWHEADSATVDEHALFGRFGQQWRHFGGLDPDEPLLCGGERQQRRPDDPTGTRPVAGRGGFRERVTHVRRVRGGPGVVVVRNGGRYVLRRQVVDFV